ncbi:gamma-glutamylcyclotransferase family protein [Candidatus Uabimicrobium amorphum]|uniref:Gamma-glutamylcyclotransferase n=1 Tax=Uabimicrobium amorphum TaxID=2596890 RepID=A0A5S9IRC2_UABAM|nr:gamma-glutamylcyclotransferase family protein [Candidatus Uabimicrobium amorphum]BBM86698.1 hypothetical protein UABAM_05084 [Candidatus Uabimicrobium amorphum]
MSTKIDDKTKISGHTTVGDWKSLRLTLLKNIQELPEDAWEKAYEIFDWRIRSRFLDPIDSILEKDLKGGEGFTIVAIQCILIEFLEAFYQGKTYTIKHKDLWVHEYVSSKQLFKDFLLNHTPFKDYFTEKLANVFYSNIRCGLLHEAQTKETSKIRASSRENLIKALDDGNMIIYRTNFQQAILQYIENYKRQLAQDLQLRRNFIRKIDELCGIEHVYYFAYGSNMKLERLLKRLQSGDEPAKIHNYCVVYLENHKFTFNKKGKDGTAKANVFVEEEQEVWGVCYEVDKSALPILARYEGGYDQSYVNVKTKNNKPMRAITYISKSVFSAPQLPSDEYYQKVLEGAQEQGLPEDYIVCNITNHMR